MFVPFIFLENIRSPFPMCFLSSLPHLLGRKHACGERRSLQVVPVSLAAPNAMAVAKHIDIRGCSKSTCQVVFHF